MWWRPRLVLSIPLADPQVRGIYGRARIAVVDHALDLSPHNELGVQVDLQFVLPLLLFLLILARQQEQPSIFCRTSSFAEPRNGTASVRLPTRDSGTGLRRTNGHFR